MGVGKSEPLGLDRTGENCSKALAGKSTLYRNELTNAKTSDRIAPGGVHKIVANHDAIETLLVRLAVTRLTQDIGEVVLDLDATDSLTHGDHEGKFFHGYYDNYCRPDELRVDECEPTAAVAFDLRLCTDDRSSGTRSLGEQRVRALGLG